MASKQARKKARKLRAKQRKLASTTKNLDSGSDSDVEATDSCQYRMIAANDIRKGKLVIIRDHHPCKITSLDHIKNGKHGKARVTVSGVDIFSGKKYSDFFFCKESSKGTNRRIRDLHCYQFRKLVCHNRHEIRR
eukprot:TRINITY_DN650_c0_g1_i2.p1 TRINITY_DN650_c0_g1~~TRINITY_DN650_c0_g1_i2.p1  ORF type:complete len:135 (+),score=18.83 TRINITY_DN650_c0_g1_i2:133-537(+)